MLSAMLPVQDPSCCFCEQGWEEGAHLVDTCGSHVTESTGITSSLPPSLKAWLLHRPGLGRPLLLGLLAGHQSPGLHLVVSSPHDLSPVLPLLLAPDTSGLSPSVTPGGSLITHSREGSVPSFSVLALFVSFTLQTTYYNSYLACYLSLWSVPCLINYTSKLTLKMF